MPAGIGLTELLVVLAVVLVIFGPKRLPGIGRSLGSGMREFKDSITGSHDDDDDEPRAALKASAEPSGARAAGEARTSDDVAGPPHA